ncbi:MAG: ABC transporter permease subunit, partial [Chloroflexia bacterium]|nr:ABC transporter permease subunit [Chloroflexia bacterium]
MRSLILRRIGFALIALLCILYLSSLGLNMARGLSFGTAMGRAVQSSGEYLWGLLQGDPGLSTSRQREPLPAGPVIANTISKSLLLLAFSLSLAALLGVLLGGLSARRRRSPWSLPILFSSLIGTSVPSFLLAMLLQAGAISFYQKTGLRLFSLGGFNWASIWLPALVLAARPLAQITRVTFFSISEALEQDYVRTAQSKGVPPGVLFRRHVYRNVAIPVFTTLVTSLRFSLISLPVVEYFFSWPGAGEALLRAIRRQDDALVYGLLLCLGLLIILLNALLEALYRLLDPRLRDGGAGSLTQREIGQLRPDLRTALGELARSFWDNALFLRLRRLFRRQPEAEESAFSKLVHQHALERGGEDLGQMHRRERRRAWFRGVLLNPPLLLGLLMLLPLLAVILFGHNLAPANPYNTIGIRFVEGQIQTPPFPPQPDFPWGSDALGRDMLSLILVGAQQTLVIAAVVMLARLALGSLFGLLAGWFEGSWLDRLVGNIIEIIAAFPALLCAMVLILALGIRRGALSFIVALCFVGWGEVAQFVRAQVVALKPRPFIEAAVVVGARWPQILSSHVLPNLLSPLVGLAALEMGAVLMLLGELGFVGIFIGGGAFAELVVFGPPYYYSDVPEWAALLSNIRGYVRSYPWMAWPPALAFSLAILAFNLTGEGLLRLIDRLGASFTRLLNRYTALAGLAFIGLVLLVRTQTGPLALYQDLSRAFDGQRALDHVQVLAGPDMADRYMGSPELDRAAEYVAAQFAAAGLQPAGQAGTYFQETDRAYFALTEVPQLALLNQDGSVGQHWTWRQDFNVPFHYPYRVDGKQRSGEIVYVDLGPLSEPNPRGGREYLTKLAISDLDGKVLLTPDRETYQAVRANCPRSECPIAGAMIIMDDAWELTSYSLGTTYSEAIYWRTDSWFDVVVVSMHPVVVIDPKVAEALLADSGTTLQALAEEGADLGLGEVLLRPLGQQAYLDIRGEPRSETIRHVLGYIPGGTGTGGSAGERHSAVQKMDDQIIILMAPYDS